METLRDFRLWLVKRRPLVIAAGVLLLLWIMQQLLTPPNVVVTHILGSSTGHVDTLWFRQDLLTNIAGDGHGNVFAVSLSGDRLIAIDPSTGRTTVEHSLSFLEGDVRGFLVGPSALYIVTTIEVNAYDRTNLSRLWSTPLGQGHVGILSQLDADVLRVYYGEQIYELDARTGRTLNVAPKDDTTWILDNTVLKGSSAFERDSGVLLWQQGPLFDPGLGPAPESAGQDQLLITRGYGWDCSCGLCTLNVRNGHEDWCRPEEFISPVAIDPESSRGYAMRSDLTLLTLDMATGQVVGETTFLTSRTRPAPEGVFPVVMLAVSDHVVVVGFSDSHQTFGLLMK